MSESEHTLLVQLTDALTVAFRDAVLLAYRNHSKEHFYAFILFTSPSFDYAALAFNTEEALRQIGPTCDQSNALRWNPPDWKYNWEGDEFFSHVNTLIGSLQTVHDRGEYDWRKTRTVFFNTLKCLDNEGLFATANDRAQVLINVMWGDQNILEHIPSAKVLNPTSSYIAYARHKLPSLYATEKEFERGRSMYKDEALAHIRRVIAEVEEDLKITPRSGGLWN